MKKFLEFSTPEENVLEPELKGSVTSKPSVDFLQSFSKNYTEFNENVKKAEELLLQLEAVEAQRHQNDEQIVKREELETILTTHLLIVNENIEHIKSDLAVVNKNNLTKVTSIIDDVNSKTQTILEYIGTELPKNKNKLYELDLTVNKKIDLLNLDITELTESTNGVYDQLEQFEESVDKKLSAIDTINEEVGSLAMAAKTKFKEINKDIAVVKDSVDSNLKLSEAAQQEVVKQITDLHEELKQANTNLTEMAVKYDEVLSPALVEINEVRETLKSSDVTIQEYYSNLDKTKAELKQVINEVNTIFINEKYVELDRKVGKIEEIFDRLAGRQTIVEEVKPEDVEVKPAGEMYSKAELDKIFTNKTFQQPNPAPVSPDFTAVTAKLKFLEQAIGRIAATGPGGGEVNLRWLDDIDRTTIADGKYLRYNATTKKFEFNSFTGTGSVALSDSPTFTGTVTTNNLTVSGNLTVDGTTTTVNSVTLTVDDNNIELGSTIGANDTTASGGGITLKGTTDKTITWSTLGWTSSEDFNLVTGKAYEINGTSVLNSTTLGSGVTASSLTSVGTIGTGTWQGSTIGVAYGGTGTSTALTAGSLVFAAASGVYSQDNANLFWDDTNNRLGIGTASPTSVLHISSSTNSSLLRLAQTGANNQATINFVTTGGSAEYALDQSGNSVFRTQQSGLYFDNFGSGSIYFRTNGSNIRMGIDSGGSVSINNLTASSAVFTDASKNLVSVATTGTGSVVLNSNPTFATDVTVNGLTVGKGNSAIATNTAVGVTALNANTTGSRNTAVGSNALLATQGGVNNTAIGASALVANTSGDGNNAFGDLALNGNTSGANNTALGRSTLLSNTVGANNVASGNFALNANTGSDNVGTGYGALLSKVGGNGNTAIGFQAGRYSGATGTTALTSASNSIYIGQDSRGAAATGDSNSIVIGSSAVGLGANTTVIGNSSTTQAKIFGALSAGADLTATSTTSIATGATASGATNTINIGTGGGAGSTTSIAIGSAAGSTTTFYGTNIVQGSLDVRAIATAITLGGTTSTATITLGQSTVTQITNIQAGATTSGNTKTLNIGTGGLAGSTSNIAIGSTAGTSTTTINGSIKGTGTSFQLGPDATLGTVKWDKTTTPANPWFGIYDNGGGKYYGIATNLPAPAGVAALGGYYQGLGVGGASNNTDTPIFGVLTNTQSGNGLGLTTFTVYDNKKIVTFNSTLDDGSGNMIVAGNLTVNGTTTTINSITLTVDDKNIELGSIASPTNTTADGGGITLKGTTDKTLNWVNSTTAWTSSEDFNLLTGKVYKINGTSVLSSNTLGSGVTASSLTSLGTITALSAGTITASADATINGVTVGRGPGNSTTNTALGFEALKLASVNSSNNVAVGYKALDNMTGAGIGNFNLTEVYGLNSSFITPNVEYYTQLVYMSGTPSTTGYYGEIAITFYNDIDLGLVLGSIRLVSKGSGYVDTTTVLRALFSDYDNGDLFNYSVEVYSLDYGSGNVAVGSLAGNTTVGDNNIYLGYNAQPSDNGSNNQIVIGANAFGRGENTTIIGWLPTTTTYIHGNLQLLDSSGNYALNSSSRFIGRFSGEFEGSWIGGTISPTYGGTGVNNGSRTLTLAGNVTHAGAFTRTFTATANTTLTLPTTGTLATLAGTETLTNKTITASGKIATTVGGSAIELNGSGSNYIAYNTAGVAAPSFTTRSAGTKIVLYPSLSASSADYAIGIDSSTTWFSVANTSNEFKWYGGTTLAATLTGAGNLSIPGGATINATTQAIDIGTSQTSGVLNLGTAASRTAAINIGTQATTGEIFIGGNSSNSTGQLIIGRSPGTQTVNIASGATASGQTKTVNIGTAGVSGSTTNINIGSQVAGAVDNIRIDGNVGILTAATSTYQLQVNGAFAATTKSFVIPHPTKPGKQLRYGSLEGPENGVYVRGKLKGNKIELPEYWTKLVDPDSITVNLTPIGKSQNLYVEDIIDNTVIVGNTSAEINCFYTVYAERIDVDKLEIEVD